MTEIRLFTDVDVKLINTIGGDPSVVRAARVSVEGENLMPEPGAPVDMGKRDAGLINYLLKSQHGSPFEHNVLSFYVKAPIFAIREFQRHRIGFSYNEMSGRYSELLPEFYVPHAERPLINVGSSARPSFVAGSETQVDLVQSLTLEQSKSSWDAYQKMLAAGVGKEIARIVLPLNIMTQMYVTCNARSMMNFLSLRTQEPGALVQSRPQYEIELIARKMEAHFAKAFPVTYQAYNVNGRVAP